MTLIEGLQSSPGFLTASTLLLGLIIGSFLNVVIVRLPRMLERDWKAEAREILELDPVSDPELDKLGLARPGSHCPGCGTRVRAWQNLPVISWLLLRGRCANCKAPISVQYPVVEALTGLVSAYCAWRFGFGLQLLAILGFSWTLIALTVIDLRTQLLPDNLTLPLLWAGLAFNLTGGLVSLDSAVIGAIAGYGVFWTIFQIFRLLTGKEGMGFGDFKLLAALGAWLGWQALPLIVILSSIVGATIGIALTVTGRLQRDKPMPFGPFLAIAGWIALMWGPQITSAWLAP